MIDDAVNSTAPQPQSLLRAGQALSAVMRHGSLDLAAVADRIERYDPNPYPLTYVLMSNHVAAFLRALAAAEHDQPEQAVTVPSQAASYGPPLREAR